MADRPIVYLSYRWIDKAHDGRPGRAPDPQGRVLADGLREQGIDVRLDVYFHESLHGFRPPRKIMGDSRDPWLEWAQEQVRQADVVLMLCTPDYASGSEIIWNGTVIDDWESWRLLSDDQRISTQGERPSVWWDWLAISRELATHPDKVIPVGFGPYHKDRVPPFAHGLTYYDLEDARTSHVLARRIRSVWRANTPREGIFVSYAHKDDQEWLDHLLTHLNWLKHRGVTIWTDRDIAPGRLWHDEITLALDRARVAILMVSPDFLNSQFITDEELPRMLDAAKSEGLTIIWIPVRPSSYKYSPIQPFQAAHPPDRPLATLSGPDRDQAFVDIGERLAGALGLG